MLIQSSSIGSSDSFRLAYCYDYNYFYQANQELGSMYPSFNKYEGNGNALERVLALELELASALQVKKSSIHFQRYFHFAFAAKTCHEKLLSFFL